MSTLICIIIICFLLLKIKQNTNSAKQPKEKSQYKEEYTPQQEDFGQNYQKKWLLTYNEKHAYTKIKEIADKYGMTVFTKVRLFDLVEPKKGNPKYKTYMYKIQAKHVDFVICDQVLVARHIIELDDSSHDTPERKERDAFVDAVLQSTGYKVLHIRNVNEEEITRFLNQ